MKKELITLLLCICSGLFLYAQKNIGGRLDEMGDSTSGLAASGGVCPPQAFVKPPPA